MRILCCIAFDTRLNPHPALRATFSQWEKEEHQPTFFNAGVG